MGCTPQAYLRSSRYPSTVALFLSHATLDAGSQHIGFGSSLRND
jgi:hypothetical protein